MYEYLLVRSVKSKNASSIYHFKMYKASVLSMHPSPLISFCPRSGWRWIKTPYFLTILVYFYAFFVYGLSRYFKYTRYV